MKVGELFVGLGVKGSEKTIGAITGTRKGLKDASSMALETKAALVGVMYTLERLFAASSRTGTDLTNLSTLLGVSVKTLQQYQYAARQVGISNQTMDGTFKALQNTITKTLMGEGAPKGLAQVQMQTGEMGQLDMLDAQKNPEHLMQRLQLYAQREKNEGLRNEVLKSFGLGDEMVAALARNAFRPEVLNKAPTYSEGEVKSLDKTNAAWANLGNKVEMSIGRFNAKHGGELVKDLSKATDQVIKLAEAFAKLAEKAHAFEALNKVFEGWALIFDGMAAVVDFISKIDSDAVAAEGPAELADRPHTTAGDYINDLQMGTVPTRGKKKEAEPEPEAPRSARASLDTFFGRRIPPSPVEAKAPTPVPTAPVVPPGVQTAVPQSPVAVKPVAPVAPLAVVPASPVAPAGTPAPRVATGAPKPDLRLVPLPSPSAPAPNAVAPSVPPVAPAAGNTNNINVNQNLNFSHEGKDAKQTADSVKKAVKEAYFQTPAIGQGN